MNLAEKFENISFLAEKLPYSQISGTKVFRPKNNKVIAVSFDVSEF